MRRTARGLMCSMLFSFAAGSHAGVSQDGVSYDEPPEVGNYLQPQPRLIHCRQARAARFSGNTGFIGEDCRPLAERDTWSVIRCTHIQLSEGGMWLVEIENTSGELRFVPIPWHDWV